MAHYKDGTPARLGDLVKGRGYNLPYDVQGIVSGLTPGAGSCDIHIACLKPHTPLGTVRTVHPVLAEEHGTCAAFELVYRDPALTVTVEDEELAADAFAAYGQSTGGLTHDGRPIPPLDKIREEKPSVFNAWVAAVRKVRSRLSV